MTDKEFEPPLNNDGWPTKCECGESDFDHEEIGDSDDAGPLTIMQSLCLYCGAEYIGVRRG